MGMGKRRQIKNKRKDRKIVSRTAITTRARNMMNGNSRGGNYL